MPKWAWILVFRHLKGVHNRPAVKWMNRFAVLGLIIGVFAWTAVVSTMRGLQNDRRDRILKQKPHILFESAPRAGLLEKKEIIKEVLGPDLKDLKFLLQTEGLFEVSARKQNGRISGSGVVIQGVESESAPTQLGIELYDQFQMKLDEPFKLHNVWRLDLPPLELTSSATFESGIYEIDRATIRIPRVRLEKWLGLTGAISRIEIQLQNPYRAEELLARLNNESGLEFKTWKTLDASLWYSLKLEMIVITLSVFFVVLIAAFSVHMALSVRVAEKSREIGILRGLGADDEILSRLYFTEGLALGCLGSGMGIFLSYLFCAGMSHFWKLPSIYYYTQMPVDWSWPVNLSLMTLAIALAAIASWWPAHRVKSIEVQEALRS